jgi:hypothetical protein
VPTKYELAILWRRSIYSKSQGFSADIVHPQPIPALTMTPIAHDAISDSTPSVESLSLAELIGVMLDRRRLLLGGAALGLLLGALYVWAFSPLYRSEGLFNLNYVSFADYKRYSPALSDRDRFLEYAARAEKFSEAQLDASRRAIGSSDALNKWVRPVFTITKTDIREAAESPKDANQFSGVYIDISTNSRELGQKLIVACGEYVRDFIIEGKIGDLVLPGLTTATTELMRADLDTLQANFDLDQLKRRRAEMTAVAGRYPSAARESPREVISTQDGGERYLSPVIQIVGIEAQISEANSELARLARDKDRLKTLVEFYKQARTKIATTKTGEELVAINEILNTVQSRKDLNDAGRDAVGTIGVELEQLRALRADYMRFAGAPSTQSQFRSILVWSPLVLAPIIGLLLAMLVAIVLEWWRRNRTTVLSVRR